MNNIDLYLSYRSQIKPADLIEWRSNSFIGWAIRAKTGQNVNHTSGAKWMRSIPSPGSSACWRDRLYVGEAVADGMKLTYLSEALKIYDGEVYWVPMKPELDRYRRDVIENAECLESRLYDYMSLLTNLVKRVKLDGNKPYCSEAWHIAYQRAGLIPKSFSPTGNQDDAGTGLRPGEFNKTGLFLNPIRIL